MQRSVLGVLFAAAAATPLATAQNGPPPAVEWVVGEALEAALARTTPWVPLLRRSTLAVGRYRLAKGGRDGQTPHDRDEAYFVVAGRAKFTAAGETRDLAPGDLVFVAAKAEHRFHDVQEDLDLLVVFSDAVPATGGMSAGPAPTEQTPYPETSQRGSARVFYWFGPDSAGQVAIDYGRPRWRPQYAKLLEQPSGRRWRFGENFWTTLDTNMPLRIGGVDVPIGLYYCVLHNDRESGLALLLLDPDAVRARRLDAYEADKTTGGLRVPLQRTAASPTAGRLHIALTVERERRDRGALVVTFGDVQLSAEVEMQPHRK